ncbi:MAG: nucleoside triphosphate pyrophosphohydrolase [Patescibacteria group bacterium]|nr:nucleoside triphosphate pyrophosphohydrolase [Patescibacteria group bacterium]
MKTTYNKLVRNKIPQIIKENRQAPIIRKLDKKEFTEELFKKLKEETKEVIGAKNDKKELMKEISDVYEVIDTIVDLYKLDKDLILRLQKDKKEKRGSFEKRIFLESVKK